MASFKARWTVRQHGHCADVGTALRAGAALIDHRNLLEQAGWESVRVIDVTKALAHGFRERYLAFQKLKSVSLELDESSLAQADEALAGGYADVMQCVLLSGHKTKDAL